MAARTAVPVTVLRSSVLPIVADPAGTTADPTTGHSIDPRKFERVVLRVSQSSGSTKTATVLAGPTLAQGGTSAETAYGPLTRSIATGATWWVGPLQSARFKQSDGKMYVDLEAGFVGTITAFEISG